MIWKWSGSWSLKTLMLTATVRRSSKGFEYTKGPKKQKLTLLSRVQHRLNLPQLSKYRYPRWESVKHFQNMAPNTNL